VLDPHPKYRSTMSKKIKPIKIFPTKEETEEKENTNDSKE